MNLTVWQEYLKKKGGFFALFAGFFVKLFVADGPKTSQNAE